MTQIPNFQLLFSFSFSASFIKFGRRLREPLQYYMDFIIKLTTITTNNDRDIVRITNFVYESWIACARDALAHSHLYLVHTISFLDKWSPDHLVVRLAVRQLLGTPSPAQEHSPVERDEPVSGRRPTACVECRHCAHGHEQEMKWSMYFSHICRCCNWHLSIRFEKKKHSPVGVKLTERSFCHQFDHSAHRQIGDVDGRIDGSQ